MDAIHYKVRYDGKIKNKAAYVILGVNKDGFKDILGIWIGENEKSKFWYSVLTDSKNREVKDVLIFSFDGLNGFKEAIVASYPNSVIQKCIIHQIRNTFKYISYKDSK
ncbi:transposase [Clostridioides sp. ZZV15-6388]|uniref:transposase n=1 Tax=unclassified Clostridioides TaxID=2635829 RepID=UPI0020D279E0|nr:IS256 family transposase ISCcl1 [Clostridioides difficile]